MGQVSLKLADRSGREDVVVCDHVIAATGYQPDMRKVPFLQPELVAEDQPA